MIKQPIIDLPLRRYFIDHDNSGHRYLVNFAFKRQWDKWLKLPEDNEESWEAPDYAERIDGALVTFENPRIK